MNTPIPARPSPPPPTPQSDTGRVPPADIEAAIVAEFYFTADAALALTAPGAVPATQVVKPGADTSSLKLLTLCVLVLANGFTLVGEAAPVLPGNFDAAIGRRYARAKAIDKVWPLLGYALKSQLADMAARRAAAAAAAAGGVGHGG